jgi:hypothetical protein
MRASNTYRLGSDCVQLTLKTHAMRPNRRHGGILMGGMDMCRKQKGNRVEMHLCSRGQGRELTAAAVGHALDWIWISFGFAENPRQLSKKGAMQPDHAMVWIAQF